MSHDSGIGVSHKSLVKIVGVAAIAVLVSAHVGSPDVFFTGKAGPYDVRVTIRPPMVVPGVARVTVRAPADVQRVSIRPVYWRAGSKGAPSADETQRQLAGEAQAGGTYEGSLWLMARGAYTVDVIVSGARGDANVLVPIASVATGRLAMTPGLTLLLSAFGILLFAGLVTIVYKAAGESLLSASEGMDSARRANARLVAAVAVSILALAVLGGARWWDAVDRDYERTLYRASPLRLSLTGRTLELAAVDSLFLPGGRVSALIPDHGKLMHLFLVKSGDASALAHLHPTPIDSSANPTFRVQIPDVPAGTYHVYGDVVHETGFERTLVATVELPAVQGDKPSSRPADPDDSWFSGAASDQPQVRLADGSTLSLNVVPPGPITAGQEISLRLDVRDATGKPATLEPYLGMAAHGVVTKLDGSVYIHLHPMGTITRAAQDAFRARDAGDTTRAGMPRLHSAHAATAADSATSVEFPYAFPNAGSYRLFVQVKRGGRVHTGAFALSIAEPPVAK
jgi:hypothetical protein